MENSYKIQKEVLERKKGYFSDGISSVTTEKIHIKDQTIETRRTRWRERKDNDKEQGLKTEWIGTMQAMIPNRNTGELVMTELQVVEKKVKHTLKRGWRRVYMADFMEILGSITTSKKLDVVEFILSNLDKENKLTMTQSQIKEKTKINIATINTTFKILLKEKFMSKVGTAYIVSPQYVCAFGSDAKNQGILTIYRESLIEEEKKEEKERIEKEKRREEKKQEIGEIMENMEWKNAQSK